MILWVQQDKFLQSQGPNLPPVWKDVLGSSTGGSGGSTGGGGGTDITYQTKIQNPSTTGRPFQVSLPLGIFTDLIPLISAGSGLLPIIGANAGLEINTTNKKLYTSKAGTYRVNLYIDYSTSQYVRTVNLKVIVGGVVKYISPNINTGYPWPSVNPPAPPPIPYKLTSIDVIVSPSELSNTFEVGAYTTSSGQTGNILIPMGINPGSYITIDKIA